jgi:sugar-specific transcriptional regulator TrmB
MDTIYLERIGLTRNESIVYLTLLHLGTARAGNVVKYADLNSGKIYDILEGLKTKGLVSESVINSVRHFSAAPPLQLLDYLELKKKALQEEETMIAAALPQLEQIRAATFKEVKAVTYTGLRGIQTAADEALASMHPGEEMLAMGITGNKDEKFNTFWKRWQNKRIQKKMRARHLFSDEGEYYKRYEKYSYTKNKRLSGITPAAIDIFGHDKVLILNYTEPCSCILIYDENIATSFKQLFEQLWAIAK